MLYTESQLKDIRTLFDQYEGKKMDSNAVIDLVSIANDMPQFNYNVKFKLTDTASTPGYVDFYTDGKLYIGIGGITKTASDLVKTKHNLCDNSIKAYNYWITYYVLNELEHLHQYMEAYGITTYEDPRVAHIYRNIFDKFREEEPVIEEKYDRMPSSFSHERSANIYAAENMYQLVQDTELEKLARVNHLDHLASGYRKNKHQRVISPVYATYRMMDIMDKSNVNDLSFGERFKHGLDISDKEYRLMFEEDRDYESIVKKLK